MFYRFSNRLQKSEARIYTASEVRITLTLSLFVNADASTVICREIENVT
jgi:hypothetical protein